MKIKLSQNLTYANFDSRDVLRSKILSEGNSQSQNLSGVIPFRKVIDGEIVKSSSKAAATFADR